MHIRGVPAESSAVAADAPPPPAAVPLPVPGRISLPLILAFAGCWIITEWLRSWVFTGFAWNPLGVVWIGNTADPLLPSPLSQWIGTYGLSGITVLLCGQLARAQQQPIQHSNLTEKQQLIEQAKVGLVFATAILLVWAVDLPATKQNLADTEITIAQPNISQADKYGQRCSLYNPLR